MSKLSEVLEVLGLEVNEEFQLLKNGKKDNIKYKINEDGSLLEKINTTAEWLFSKYKLIHLILRDDLAVDKKRYDPRDFDDYYFWVGFGGNIEYYGFDDSDEFDLYNLAIGNCFKTEQDALKNKEWIMDMFDEIRQGSRLNLSNMEELENE